MSICMLRLQISGEGHPGAAAAGGHPGAAAAGGHPGAAAAGGRPEAPKGMTSQERAVFKDSLLKV